MPPHSSKVMAYQQSRYAIRLTKHHVRCHSVLNQPLFPVLTCCVFPIKARPRIKPPLRRGLCLKKEIDLYQRGCMSHARSRVAVISDALLYCFHRFFSDWLKTYTCRSLI